MIILFLFQIFNLLLRWLRGRGAEKNNTVLFYYVDHVNRGLFESVDHKYMVHGHSFLENDQDFAQIENRKKYSMVLLPDEPQLSRGQTPPTLSRSTKCSRESSKIGRATSRACTTSFPKIQMEIRCSSEKSIGLTLAGGRGGWGIHAPRQPCMAQDQP